MSGKTVAVSSDERREIARRLRAGAEYLPNDMYADDLELELAKTVCRYDTPSVDVLFNRLANLIEPEPERTCHDTDCARDSITCSECGEITRKTLFWVDVDEGRTVKGHRPRFCSNCGAKVVGND